MGAYVDCDTENSFPIVTPVDRYPNHSSSINNNVRRTFVQQTNRRVESNIFRNFLFFSIFLIFFKKIKKLFHLLFCFVVFIYIYFLKI